MTALLELQHAMRGSTLYGDDEIASQAIRADGIAPQARLQIHRNHFFTTLTDTLAANFPVVCRLVGRGFFGFLAHRFIEMHPPRQPCLFEYGTAFPDFIGEFPACRELPYLADVARLEWAINNVFHAPDLPSLTPELLRDVAQERLGSLRFVLHPAARLVSSRYPIARIWQANQPDGSCDETTDLQLGGVRLLVHRQDDDVQWRLLSLPEHMFLRALAAGQKLDEAIDTAGEGSFGFTVLFAELLTGGIFAGFINPKPMRMS